MGTPKKEIDKEYLFNLLMPTAASDLPEDLPAAPAPSAAARTPAPEGAGLSALGSGVKVRPARELMLVNLNERLVADRLDEVFEKFRCCRCDRCRQDVAPWPSMPCLPTMWWPPRRRSLLCWKRPPPGRYPPHW